MTSLLIGFAASVITQPSLVAVQTAVVQRASPIPGFTESLEQIRNLLDRGRGIEAENVARALLARVESRQRAAMPWKSPRSSICSAAPFDVRPR